MNFCKRTKVAAWIYIPILCFLPTCSSEVDESASNSEVQIISLDQLFESFSVAKTRIRKDYRLNLSRLILAEVDRVQLDWLEAYSTSAPEFDEDEVEGVKVFSIAPYDKYSSVSKTIDLTGEAMVQLREIVSNALREGSDASKFGHNPSLGITCFKSEVPIFSTSFGFETKNFFVIYPGGELDYDWVEVDANLATLLLEAAGGQAPEKIEKGTRAK